MSHNPNQPNSFEIPADFDSSLPNQSSSTHQTTAEDERTIIWRAIYALGHNFDAFANRQSKESEENHKTLQAIVSQLDKLNTGSQAANRNASGVPRFREPRMYDGSAMELDPFVREVTTALYLQRHSLVTDRDKSLYLASYLKDGSPTSWLTAIEKNQPTLFDSYDAFLSAFKKHFEDSDRYATALYKIRQLRQDSTSAATYASRFRELAWILELTDQTKIQMFYDGLKENVKDALTISTSINDAPSSFDDYVKTVIKIDNHLHRRDLERSLGVSDPVPDDPFVSILREPSPTLPSPPPSEFSSHASHVSSHVSPFNHSSSFPASPSHLSSNIDQPFVPFTSDPTPEDNSVPMEIDATKQRRSK